MKFKKVLLQAYYNSHGDYTAFPYNPLHNKSFENVRVRITKEKRTMCGVDYAVDIVKIEGQKLIECEVVGQRTMPDGTLVIGICQDWG